MNRPYIACHMVTSIDGKVTGGFLSNKESSKACEIYYEINRELRFNGFICGRVTMEGSFTGGYYPDLSSYKPVKPDPVRMDFILDEEYMSGFYAVAFDTNGKLGWKSNRIIDSDGDPGYDGAQIIEVLSEDVDERYLGYLENMEIPYIFAGKDEIDIETALFKLKTLFGIDALLLEGGSIINGAFQRADCIDELSLVVAPVIAAKNDKTLFTDSIVSGFELTKAETKDGVLVMNYRKNPIKQTNNNVKIKWQKAMTIDEAIADDSSDTRGLYYISRVFGKKETTLYLGIATHKNTIRHRLRAHKSWWLKEYRGTIKVRIGKIIYPYANIDEVIDHAESAILYEQKDLFLENTAKIKSYSYNTEYCIENIGDIFELKPIIDMLKHT